MADGREPVPWGDVPYMQNNVSPFGMGLGTPSGTEPKPQAKVPTGLEDLPEGTQKSLFWKALEVRRREMSKFYIEVMGKNV